MTTPSATRTVFWTASIRAVAIAAVLEMQPEVLRPVPLHNRQHRPIVVVMQNLVSFLAILLLLRLPRCGGASGRAAGGLRGPSLNAAQFTRGMRSNTPAHRGSLIIGCDDVRGPVGYPGDAGGGGKVARRISALELGVPESATPH